MTTQEIVSKLWNLCNVLRDDGITYHQYVTELTYILFLKMAKETGAESQCIPYYPDAAEICQEIEAFILELQQTFTSPQRFDVEGLFEKGAV